MSWPLSERVAKTPMPWKAGKELLQLLALRGDDDGCHCRPSVKTLMRETGMGRRAVQRGLRRLEEQGRIATTAKSPGRPTEYRIVLEKLVMLTRRPKKGAVGEPPLAAADGAARQSRGGGPPVPEGAVVGPPDSILDSVEHSSEVAVADSEKGPRTATEARVAVEAILATVGRSQAELSRRRTRSS